MEGEEERQKKCREKCKTKINKQNGKRGRNKQRRSINMFTGLGCEAR
jgi:hypothetical protein